MPTATTTKEDSSSKVVQNHPLVCLKRRNYDATYGSLGAAIGPMIWMSISSIVILLGAELNSKIEHQTAQKEGALANG
jgi:hypothetical protein